MKPLKDLILSGFMSLSKAEQAVLREVINSSGNEVQQEQQVRKNEIKIISRKRFYDILDKADNIITQRDKDKLIAIMEQRGFSENDVTIKNTIHTDFLGNVEFKFKTDNGLFRFASHVNVIHLGGNQRRLEFFVNTYEHKSIIAHYDRLANLSYFEVMDNRKTYSFTVSNFISLEKNSPFEVSLSYEAIVIQNGTTPIIEEEEDRIMTKRDLLNKSTDPNTYTLGERDFL